MGYKMPLCKTRLHQLEHIYFGNNLQTCVEMEANMLESQEQVPLRLCKILIDKYPDGNGMTD